MNHLINSYKECPKCKETKYLEVRNYRMILQEGEVWCYKCNVYVREYDAS